MGSHEKSAHSRHWYRVYRARMRAGLEPCRYGCGTPACSFDRLVPRREGGRYTFDNVTLACVACNSARGHQPAPPGLRSLQAEEATRAPLARWSLQPAQLEVPAPTHRRRTPEHRARQRRRQKDRIRAHRAVERERSGAT